MAASAPWTCWCWKTPAACSRSISRRRWCARMCSRPTRRSPVFFSRSSPPWICRPCSASMARWLCRAPTRRKWRRRSSTAWANDAGMSLPLRGNRVIPLLALLALALLWCLDFVSIQPNRIAPGSGLGLLAALGPVWALLLTGLLLACALLALRSPRPTYGPILALVWLLLLQLPASLAWSIERHIGADLPYARVGIGAGCWSLLFLLGLLLIELQQRLRLSRLWLLGGALVLAA